MTERNQIARQGKNMEVVTRWEAERIKIADIPTKEAKTLPN
jgi:hypothetical protein